MMTRFAGSRATGAGLAVLLLVAATPGLAQSGQAAPADVDAYVCKFAGKCASADAGVTPSMAAPATKGFRLAAPSAGASAGTRESTAPAKTTAASANIRARTAVATRARTPVVPRRVVPAGTRADLSLAFEYNSDRLTDDAKSRARVFATALMTPELRAKRFMIEGHTDSRGPRPLNVDLSRRRAEAVAGFLTEQGVDRTRLQVRGYGPDRPLPGVSRAAESNRRVEAVLLS